MMKFEDKEQIAYSLLPVLRCTRQGRDIIGLRYEQLKSGDEVVHIQYKSGADAMANVTLDSGIAMIKDIIRAIS